MKFLAAFIGCVAAWGRDGCQDLEGVDSGGDGCDWYTGYEGLCGRYDTEDFTATEICCDSCVNPYEMVAGCVDTEGVDRSGETCEFYKTHWTSCGKFDTETFIAKDLCCACDPEG